MSRTSVVAKGKKRAAEDVVMKSASASSSSLSPPPPEEPDIQKVKRQKRAETRACPVCQEQIPIRLLGKHAVLEMQRVDEILHSVDPIMGETPAESSTSRRGAALRARKSLRSMKSRSGPGENSLEQAEHTIRLIKRNRKQRHTRLKEMLAQEDDIAPQAQEQGSTCPVCLTVVAGDQDVVEAHVDACVAHASREAEAMQASLGRDAWGEVRIDGEVRIRLTDVNALRGSGFDIRDTSQVDIDDDIDVDGDDADGFGEAQFTEQDVLASSRVTGIGGEDGNVDIEDGGGPVEVPKKADAVEVPSQSTPTTYVSSAAPLMCRICLDPYTEPTVSTGCWHTCCRECWLRCLGSTKQCPICKRITIPTELRKLFM